MNYKQCVKRGNSPSDAWRVAKKLRKQGDEVHAYHCTICGSYHVGYDRDSRRHPKTQRRQHERH